VAYKIGLPGDVMDAGYALIDGGLAPSLTWTCSRGTWTSPKPNFKSLRSRQSLRRVSIGPDLVFGKLWRETGCGDAINGLLRDRRFGFDVERVIYLSALH
jgi:hypothetical protein